MNIYARAAATGKRVQVSVLLIFFVLIALSLGVCNAANESESCSKLIDYCAHFLVQHGSQKSCDHHA